MKKLKISASFLCLCVVIILTSLAFFYQKGNTTDGTVGSDSPDKENTLKPSASKGSDEFVNNADASEHSQSSHAEIDYSTYESTTLGISISYPAALQDIMAIAEGESYEGFIAVSLTLSPAFIFTLPRIQLIVKIQLLLKSTGYLLKKKVPRQAMDNALRLLLPKTVADAYAICR